MSATVVCSRCGLEKAALTRNPLPGPTGTEVRARVCAECWNEWLKQEVMVINELRLNFMDPRSGDILDEHMRRYLCLEPPAGAP